MFILKKTKETNSVCVNIYINDIEQWRIILHHDFLLLHWNNTSYFPTGCSNVNYSFYLHKKNQKKKQKNWENVRLSQKLMLFRRDIRWILSFDKSSNDTNWPLRKEKEYVHINTSTYIHKHTYTYRYIHIYSYDRYTTDIHYRNFTLASHFAGETTVWSGWW